MPEVELVETGKSGCGAKLYFMSILWQLKMDKCSLGLDRIVMTKSKEKIFQIG